jgi:AcrR family transcriptional regulator
VVVDGAHAREGSPRPRGRASDTREQILDVAERLFSTQGYEATSLREIAEQMGFSKAALYYHFTSKTDILMALHLRLHEVGLGALDQWGRPPSGLAEWGEALQSIATEIVAHRDLLVLHTRNRAAFAELEAHHTHDEQTRDLEAMVRAALSDPTLTAAERVRLAAAIGSVMFGAVSVGEFLGDVPVEDVVAELRAAVARILGLDTPLAPPGA